MLNFQQIDESGKTKNIKAEVVGVMEEGTNVIGNDFGQGQILQNDYRDIYSTYRYEQEKSVLILIGEQKAKENGVTSAGFLALSTEATTSVAGAGALSWATKGCQSGAQRRINK